MSLSKQSDNKSADFTNNDESRVEKKNFKEHLSLNSEKDKFDQSNFIATYAESLDALAKHHQILENDVLYHIAIIDFLQEYTIRKRLERLIKSTTV